MKVTSKIATSGHLYTTEGWQPADRTIVCRHERAETSEQILARLRKRSGVGPRIGQYVPDYIYPRRADWGKT